MTDPVDNRGPAAYDILRYLESSAFRDLAGTHLSARIPVSRLLLNKLAADALRRTSAPVRNVDVQPHDGDRFDLVVTVTWPFVPPLRIAFVVEVQPRFPESPVLVLRWSLMGGVGTIASRFVSSLDRLPHGVRLDGDRLMLDVEALAASRQLDHLLPFLSGLEVHTAEGQIVFDVALDVR
ncbi:MAG TPA: hypothetical protein VM818_14010 [Vicinamibacterales bacterium]|nr:hypothetical protein [Vicinamibacterales bacterium]